VHGTDSLGVQNILFLSFFLATGKRSTYLLFGSTSGCN
jgi:hypothetical protein